MYVLRMIAQRIRHNTLGALVFFGRQWKYIKADEQTRQFVARGLVMQWLKRIEH